MGESRFIWPFALIEILFYTIFVRLYMAEKPVDCKFETPRIFEDISVGDNFYDEIYLHWKLNFECKWLFGSEETNSPFQTFSEFSSI